MGNPLDAYQVDCSGLADLSRCGDNVAFSSRRDFFRSLEGLLLMTRGGRPDDLFCEEVKPGSVQKWLRAQTEATTKFLLSPTSTTTRVIFFDLVKPGPKLGEQHLVSR